MTSEPAYATQFEASLRHMRPHQKPNKVGRVGPGKVDRPIALGTTAVLLFVIRPHSWPKEVSFGKLYILFLQL